MVCRNGNPTLHAAQRLPRAEIRGKPVLAPLCLVANPQTGIACMHSNDRERFPDGGSVRVELYRFQSFTAPTNSSKVDSRWLDSYIRH